MRSGLHALRESEEEERRGAPWQQRPREAVLLCTVRSRLGVHRKTADVFHGRHYYYYYYLV